MFLGNGVGRTFFSDGRTRQLAGICGHRYYVLRIECAVGLRAVNWPFDVVPPSQSHNPLPNDIHYFGQCVSPWSPEVRFHLVPFPWVCHKFGFWVFGLSLGQDSGSSCGQAWTQFCLSIGPTSELELSLQEQVFLLIVFWASIVNYNNGKVPPRRL